MNAKLKIRCSSCQRLFPVPQLVLENVGFDFSLIDLYWLSQGWWIDDSHPKAHYCPTCVGFVKEDSVIVQSKQLPTGYSPLNEGPAEGPAADASAVAAPTKVELSEAQKAAAEKRKKQEAVRGKAKAKVVSASNMLAQACVTLLQSDLPDRFLRVGRLVKLGNTMQLELSDRIAELRQRGGVYPMVGGGQIAGVNFNDDPEGVDVGYGDLVAGPNLNGLLGVNGNAPVPDNIQLLRELVGGMGNKINDALGVPLPAKEITPYELSSALDAKRALKEAGESTEEIDAFIAAAKASFARQAKALEAGAPDPKAVAQRAQTAAEMQKGMQGGAALGKLVADVKLHNIEGALGNGAVPYGGFLNKPVLLGDEGGE